MKRKEQDNIEKYFRFEAKNKLFDYKYKGVNFWMLIRCWEVYYQVAGYPNINRESERSTNDYISELILNIRKCCQIFRFCLKRKKADLLVSGSVALRNGLDGEKIYQYFPFLEKQETYSYIFHNTNVKDDTKSDEINQSLINLILAFMRIVTRLKRKFIGYHNEDCKKIAESLVEEFDINITHSELERSVEESVLQYKIARWYYSWIIKRFKFKIILMEPGYATEHFALSEVAHKMGIPVIEFQHGILNSTHPAYNYFDKEKDYFCLPDYVFTWGDVWSRMIHMPTYVKIVTCGYPYFDINRKNVEHIKEKKCISFFTNLYTEKLVDIALGLEQMDCKEEVEIVVKFHPYLHHDWNLNKDKFKGSRIKVINDASTNIYELIARSRYCVGYSSTVLFETIAMGKTTYAMKVDGSISKDLEGIEDILLPIDTAQNLYESMMSECRERVEDRSDKIMKKHAEENILNELSKILRG